MTGQMKIETQVLPDLWMCNGKPNEDGFYLCRIKDAGEYKVEMTEYKDGEFKTTGTVIAWR